MKCPKCEGTRFLGKEWRRASAAFEAQWWDKKCIHCDGTGEIEPGSVWLGTLRTFTCIAVASERGWMILCGEKMIVEEDFKPITRMKEVK